MIIITDVSTKKWRFKDKKFYPPDLEIKIGFTDKNRLPVFFNNLSFEIFLLYKNKIIFKDLKPNNGINYFSTNESFIESFLIKNIYPNAEYSLKILIENNEEKWSKNILIKSEAGYKPYNSWILSPDGSRWVAPIKKPDDKYEYIWIEESKEWYKIPNSNYEVE